MGQRGVVGMVRGHTERDQRDQAQTVTIATTAPVDLGKGRHWCDLRTFPMCRHPMQSLGLGRRNPFHLSTAHRGSWAGSHSARQPRSAHSCLLPGHPVSIGLSLLEVTGNGRGHPTAPAGSRKEAGVWYSAGFRPGQLLPSLGSSPWLQEWSLVFWVCSCGL